MASSLLHVNVRLVPATIVAPRYVHWETYSIDSFPRVSGTNVFHVVLPKIKAFDFLTLNDRQKSQKL